MSTIITHDRLPPVKLVGFDNHLLYASLTPDQRYAIHTRDQLLARKLDVSFDKYLSLMN